MNLQKKTGKNAVICFILCIPMFFIAFLAIKYANERIESDEYTSVELIFPDSNQIKYTDKETIDFYIDIFNSSPILTKPLREASDEEAIIVSCVRSDATVTYRIYPELSTTGCMFKASGDRYFLISEINAKKLLSMDDFSYLYKATTLPSMYVVTGELSIEAEPKSYDWQYRRINGEYSAFDKKALASESQNLSVYSDRINKFVFSREPDDVTVIITDPNGKLIDTDDISSLSFYNDTPLKVTVNAKWNHTGTSECHGNATYSFDLLYDIPAELTVKKNEVQIGSTIMLDVRFLNENESVILDSELKTSSLYFTENNGIKTAAMAVDDSNSPGNYTVKYKIGDNEGSFALTVTGTKREDRNTIYRLPISKEKYSNTLSAEAQQKFYALLEDINSKRGNTSYIDEVVFAPPTQKNPTVTYGTRIIINFDNTAETEIMYSTGNNYSVPYDTNVYAAENGKVIYIGYTEALGEFMVIDHGCGVCSWYYNISNIRRSVGTEVSKGSIIASSTKSSLIEDENNSIGFFVTVGNVFASPFFE